MTPGAPRDELGAHMSIAGGLPRALERGAALGCGAIQVFVKNQRQWAARPLPAEEIAAFRAARRRTRIRHAFAHASYLINLAAPSPAAWRQAVDAFTLERARAEALGLDALVIHPGSHLGGGARAGITRATRALREGLARTRGARVVVALENTAGAGGTLGRTFDELGALLGGANDDPRLGVCLDTCHLHAAGYDLGSAAGYAAVVEACAREVGLPRVLAFHLNDARAPRGSGLDRHEHIGRGGLGLAPFRRLLADQRFARIPKVLETPKDPEPAADRRNLATLRRLRATGTPSRRPAGRAQ